MVTFKLDFRNASPGNIWNYRQNHPELVIKDMADMGLTPSQLRLLRLSMMARGINKWLKVRRDLIAYKKRVKHEVKDLIKKVPELKKDMTDKWVDLSWATAYEAHEYHKAREQYLINKALLEYKQQVRGDLKTLCMTERWQEWEGKKLEDMNTIKESD